MNKNIKKICIVTGSRAEYGIFKPLLKSLVADNRFEVLLAVTGMHLLSEYGQTEKQISKDGFKIAARLPMYQGKKQNDQYYIEAIARAEHNFSLFFTKTKPDAVVVLGDRPEPFATTIAAAFLKIPIIHLHGGERTESTDIDESIRHAISRFASLHLVATSEAKTRLIKFGEEPWRIHTVGALGIESLLTEPIIARSVFYKEFDLLENKPFLLAMFHPIHLEPEKAGVEMDELLAALRELALPTILIFPNNDAGNEAIIRRIEAARNWPFLKMYRSLPHDRYASALRYAGAMVGNSSSGIIETAIFQLPVVNIGKRQQTRPQAGNVINVPPLRASIVRALRRVLTNTAFRSGLKKLTHPYGTGKTVQKIIQILAATDFKNQKYIAKKITF